MKSALLVLSMTLTIVALSRPASAATCEVYIVGQSSASGELTDYFNNELWNDSDYINLGNESTASACFDEAIDAITDYGFDLCHTFESGRDLDVMGEVYFGLSYYNSWIAPSECTDYIGGPGGLNNYAVLGSGESLDPGDDVENGDFRLVYQADGNIVVYDGSTPIWAGNCWPSCQTWGSAGYAEMQSDGNFVVYNSVDAAVWASATDGNDDAFLALRNDGELVVYSTDGEWLWSSVRGHP